MWGQLVHQKDEIYDYIATEHMPITTSVIIIVLIIMFTKELLVLNGLPWLPPSVAILNTSSKLSVLYFGSWMVKTLDASRALLTASSIEAE